MEKKKKLNWNFFLYGCESREEFYSVENQRNRFNHKIWRIISVICFFYFVFLFFTSFSIETVADNAKIYVVMAAISFVSSLLLLTVAKPGGKLMMPIIYFMCFTLLGFGVTVGSVLSPEHLSVTFHVLLIGLPLLLIDKPYRMSILELIMAVAFIVLVFLTKTGDTRQLDVYNAIVFVGLGQIVNYYMVSTKMNELLVDKRIELASLKDELTGLRNRKAYEDDLSSYPSVPTEKDFVYVSLDVNELKIVNDSLGHAAGDELLKGAADCIRTCFGPYGRTYRIGGDEFAAIIFANEERLTEIKADFENEYINWRGQIVDQLTVSAGYASKREWPTDTVEDIAKHADKKMYEDKANHYKKKGVDRRGQQAAHTALLGLYTKILKVNITDDTYRVINMNLEEQSAEHGFGTTLSGWLKGFGASDQVHKEDLPRFLEQTDLEYMRSYFRGGKNLLSVFYRRKCKSGFEEVVMELIPANDYTNESQTLFLYVKSIDKNKENM